MSRSKTIWPMGPDIHVRSWGAHSGKSRELVECHPVKCLPAQGCRKEPPGAGETICEKPGASGDHYIGMRPESVSHK